MALRTFRSNPALGGFGGESSAPLVNRTGNAAIRVVDCDAFAQIIKELVDNAVDACSVNTHGNDDTDNNNSNVSGGVKKKRVRVSIERVNPSEDDDDGEDESESGSGRHQAGRNQASSTSGKQEILRVTVLDNGCGMNDIQASVDAFHTSKAHAARVNQDHDSDSDYDDGNQGASTARGEGRTAGRYGIGLTLCLLHAQRLVPNSCATIKSATADAAHYDFVTCVVDTEGDSVRCIRRQQLPKSFADESGTAVSVLVPVSYVPRKVCNIKHTLLGEKACSIISVTRPIILGTHMFCLSCISLLTGWCYSHVGLATSSRVFCSIQTKPGSAM
jgi:hypothetical protein